MCLKSRNFHVIVPKSSEIMDEDTITDDHIDCQDNYERDLEVYTYMIGNIKNDDLRMSKKSRYFIQI